MVETYLPLNMRNFSYSREKIFIGEREDEINDRFTLSHFIWYR